MAEPGGHYPTAASQCFLTGRALVANVPRWKHLILHLPLPQRVVLTHSSGHQDVNRRGQEGVLSQEGQSLAGEVILPSGSSLISIPKCRHRAEGGMVIL